MKERNTDIMKTLVNAAAVQLQAKLCSEFEQFFINHIDEFATNENEQRALNEWQTKSVARRLAQYGRKITNLTFRRRDDGVFIEMEYSVGPDDRDYAFFYQSVGLKECLFHFFTSNIEFLTWHDEARAWGLFTRSYLNDINITNFKISILEKFLTTTYSPAERETWRKMGVECWC